jgi:hypothetical protein
MSLTAELYVHFQSRLSVLTKDAVSFKKIFNVSGG